MTSLRNIVSTALTTALLVPVASLSAMNSLAAVNGATDAEVETCAEARAPGKSLSPDCLAVETRIQDQAEKLNEEIVSMFIQEDLKNEAVRKNFDAKLDELFQVNKKVLGKRAAKKAERQLEKLYKHMAKLGQQSPVDTAEKEKALSLYRLSQDPLFKKNMRAAANAAQARVKKLPRKERAKAIHQVFNEEILKREPRALAYASGGKLRSIAQGDSTFSCGHGYYHLALFGKTVSERGEGQYGGTLDRESNCSMKIFGPGLFYGVITLGFCSSDIKGTAVGVAAGGGALLAPGIGLFAGTPGVCVAVTSLAGIGAYAGIGVLQFD